MEFIMYRKGYKYQLHDDYTVDINFKPPGLGTSDYIELTTDGHLTVKRGYAWDGPSGPTFDTHTFMRGALVHDALYQLMREGELDGEKYKIPADKLLKEMCLADGMNWFRAQYVYFAVSRLAGFAIDPANSKKPARAPEQ